MSEETSSKVYARLKKTELELIVNAMKVIVAGPDNLDQLPKQDSTLQARIHFLQ